MAYVFGLTMGGAKLDLESAEADVVYLEEFQVINTTDFREFLLEWREVHKELVETIHFYKRNKNNMCLIGEYEAATISWNEAVKLGKLATRLYTLRDQLKASYEAEKVNELLASKIVYEVRT